MLKCKYCSNVGKAMVCLYFAILNNYQITLSEINPIEPFTKEFYSKGETKSIFLVPSTKYQIVLNVM